MFSRNLKLTLCRTCLTTLSENNTFNVFSTPDLDKKLMLCSTLPSEVSDKYPENVCRQCYEQILLFYKFQQMCCKSLDKFNELLKSKDSEEERHLQDQSVNVEEEICKTNDPLKEDYNLNLLEEKSCQLTDSVINSKTELLGKKKRGRPPKKKIDTDIEEAKFSTRAADKKNKFKRDNQEENEVLINCKTSSNEKLNEEVITTFCMLDELNLKSQNKDKTKIHTETTSPFTTEFSTSHFYNKHLKEHKTVECHDYKCLVEGCQRSYKNKSALNVHKRKYHHEGLELKTHMCEVCGKVFKSSAILTDHRYTHYDKTQLPYVCEEEECTKRFSNKEKLKIHKMRHAGIKNFICPYCGMRKTTRNELKIHINYHTLERTWPCRFCSKVCNSAGNLKMHIRNIHERAKDFACRFCERTFAKPDTKKYHEMTHTGEKPHECKECGRRFLQPAALRTHRKIHLRGKGKLKENHVSEDGVQKEKRKEVLNDMLEGGKSLVMEDMVAEMLSDATGNLKY